MATFLHCLSSQPLPTCGEEVPSILVVKDGRLVVAESGMQPYFELNTSSPHPVNIISTTLLRDLFEDRAKLRKLESIFKD